MTIRYKCEECGAALNINDELAGTEGSCPRCHVEFIVPSADESPAKPVPAKKPRSTGALDTEDDISDFLSSDEIPVLSGQTSLADAAESDSDDNVNPFDDDEPRERRRREEEELEARSKKKKSKPADEGKGKKSGDSHDSAAIAKSLMGKGAAAVEEEEPEPEPGKKKKRRQFGEGSDRPAGEISSVREVIQYVAKMGWPAAVGIIVILVICGWVYSKMQKKLDVPPLANVSGTVTIDGKPVAPGTIVQFLPVEAAKNTKLGPSIGFTGENGKYTLQYTVEYAGAVIGKHFVLIKPSDPSQGIPDRYGTTFSNLQVDVTTDGKPIDIALKSDPPPEKQQ